MPHTANASVVPVTAPAEDLSLDHRHSIFELRDGRVVVVRPVQASDEPAILEFLESRSISTRRLRFFTTARDLRAAAHWAPRANGRDQLGLVALNAESHVVGHAAYARMYGPRAEVAVEVADDMHHVGLGTRLVTSMAQVAEQHGIAHFVAEVLPENGEMLAVFRDGFAPIQHRESGVIEIEFPSAGWRLAQRRLG
jgi:L-amino acid N-acyltransferase YncA